MTSRRPTIGKVIVDADLWRSMLRACTIGATFADAQSAAPLVIVDYANACRAILREAGEQPAIDLHVVIDRLTVGGGR